MRFLTLFACMAVALAKKPRCSRDKMQAIASCAEGVKPIGGTDGCPSCLPQAFNKNKCGKAEMEACAKPSACADGVEPERNGCCITCTKQAPKCTKTQKDTCKTSIDSLSVCPTSADPKSFFNASTCCITCKRPARADPSAKCSKVRCTAYQTNADIDSTDSACPDDFKDEFKTCIDNAPDCGAVEKPLREKSQCCVTCRRPARDAPLREVGKCGNVPDCAANETSVRVTDDSGAFVCPTCKLPKPVCDPVCTTGQICARASKDDAGVVTKSCKAKKQKKLKMRASDAANKAFLQSATSDEIKAMLQEVVDRFCDKVENADKCDKNQDTLNEGMQVSITSSSADEVQVSVDIPDVMVVGRRLARRLTDSVASLLDDAMADPDATGSLTMTDSDVAAPMPYKIPQEGFDASPNCRDWAANGECTTNPDFMVDYCQASCTFDEDGKIIVGKDVDTDPSCAGWAAMGECTKNAKYMHEFCRASCSTGGKANSDASLQ